MTRLCFGMVIVMGVGAGCGGHRCEGDLSSVGSGCAEMFDGTVAQFPPCPAYAVLYAAHMCGDLISLDASGTFSGGSCYYDAASHQLVGAVSGTDIPQFCEGTSSDISAGRVPTSCASEALATKDCRSQP